MPIKILYIACDGSRKNRTFAKLSSAQRYAWDMVGERPDLGSDYAVSSDGIGTIRVTEGATLKDIFPGER